MRGRQRGDRHRWRSLGQPLCLLCADSRVGLWTRGHPGDLLGGQCSQAHRGIWHSTGVSQQAQHKRTNSEKCHLRPVPGPLSLRTTFLGCTGELGSASCSQLRPLGLCPLLCPGTHGLCPVGVTCPPLPVPAQEKVCRWRAPRGRPHAPCAPAHYLPPMTTQSGVRAGGWRNLRTIWTWAKG